MALKRVNVESLTDAEREKYRAKLQRIADWQRANPDRTRAATARYRAAHPERRKASRKAWNDANAEAKRAANAAWWAANPDKARSYSAKWIAANPEKVRATRRRWQQSHKPYKVAAQQKRKAMLIAAPGRGITPEEWQQILSDSLGLCAYCNERNPLTLDHIEPLARGGAHDIDNAAAVCVSCNASKNDTPLLLWLAKRAIARAA